MLVVIWRDQSTGYATLSTALHTQELSLTQGYVSVRIGIMEARSQRDLGIAGIIAAMLVIKGATWAFGVGILLCVLIYGKRFFSGEVDKTFVKDWDEASQPVEDPEPEVPLRK